MGTAIRQRRDDSPLLHPEAAEALVLASRALGDRAAALGGRVVGVVFDDGTVQAVGGPGGQGRRWNTGALSGPDWTLWWERRKWQPESERTPA